MRAPIEIGTDGRVPIGAHWPLPFEQPPGSMVEVCLHPTGHHCVLSAPLEGREYPVLLYTHRPNYRCSVLKTTRQVVKNLLRPNNSGLKVGVASYE